jgi:hypothetical protein
VFDKHYSPNGTTPKFVSTARPPRVVGSLLVLDYPRDATYIADLNGFGQMNSTLRRNDRSQPSVSGAMGHVVPVGESGAKK